MEPHNTSLPNISSRHKLLQRSCSVQPEVEPFRATSPYSSRRKAKNPGRSLTEIFTSKTRARASSNDRSYTLRRRTFTVGTPLVKASVLKEDEEKVFLNRSFSERPLSSLWNDNHSVCGSQYEGENYRENGRGHDSLSMLDMSKLKREVEGISSPSDKKEKCSNDKKSDDVEPSYLWHIFKNILKIFFWLIVLLVVITLLVLGISTYYVYEKTQCDLKRKVKMPLEELSNQLRLSVIGQEIAISVILNSLRNFQFDKVESPLIMWMVGCSGSGKTHTTNILRNVLSSASKVFTILPSLYPQNDKTLLEKEVYGLYNQLDPCSYNVIVIDGWDEGNQPFMILEQLVHYLKEKIHQKSSKGKTIIVLCGTQGSQYVNREYMKLFLSGKGRTDILINDFTSVSESVIQIKEMNNKTQSIVLVPFLPMEAEQVRQCIIEELSRLEKYDLTKGYDQEKIIGQVIKQLNFVPSNHPLIASTGCKRVQPLLRLSFFKNLDIAL